MHVLNFFQDVIHPCQNNLHFLMYFCHLASTVLQNQTILQDFVYIDLFLAYQACAKIKYTPRGVGLPCERSGMLVVSLGGVNH